jgi:two-component system, LytTR family, sensor kinase
MAQVMNGILSTASGGISGERPFIVSERPDIRAESPAAASAPSTASIRFFRRMAGTIIFVFWFTRFIALALTRSIEHPDESWTHTVPPRIYVTLFGLALSFAMLGAFRLMERSSLLRRIVAAAALACAVSAIHGVLAVSIFSHYTENVTMGWPSFALAVMDWLWFYASLSVMLLALAYGADLAESEARNAALQTQADAAQLKALRYQLNPHFLFNTLNSVASLISKRRHDEAESMVVSLSDFLRSTVQMDPAIEIPLGAEIELQSLYLEIERNRFPHRLKVTIDIADGLADVLVPNLITQPLIENAIKYGVARSSAPVHIEVIARQQDGLLSLVIRDDGGNAEGIAPPGTKVGLRNVSDRLRLAFGKSGRLIAGPRPEGGFAAQILMPLRKA